MSVYNNEDYQKALHVVQNLVSKDINQLSAEEQEQLNNALSTIEKYKMSKEPAPVVTEIP